MPAASADNVNAHSDNIISTIKDTKLYVLAVTVSARDNQKLSKLLSKGFGRKISLLEWIKKKKWE